MKVFRKPVIDPVSEKITKGRVTEMKGKNVWEHLYNLDKELTGKRDQLHLEKQLMEEESHLKKCTFQPEIINGHHIDFKRDATYNRTQQWKHSVEEKYWFILR